MTIINEIKQRTDITEVIAEYIPLQKAGRNLKALCPFHSEKHPSFFVFPEQQTWHCFGACGTGGDVFSFIMKKEGVDFGQALQLLARRAGITLSSPDVSREVEDKKKDRLYQINETATEYYHHLLLTTKAGELARGYLAKRKIMPETIKEFRLGFSPDSWEAAKNYLMNKGYEEKEIIEAGLLIEKESGGSYDRFRGRLMFPICDIQGRVTGLGARALDNSLPKYTNSPQTSIFDKSSNLYGIDNAKTAIRKKNQLIIVEGYMDVLTAHQHGWQNVVASMGTSLTEKQVALIKSLTKNISLALDADAAGEEATLRGAQILPQSLDRKASPALSWSHELARSLHKGKTPDLSPSLAGLVKYQSILDAEIKVITLPEGEGKDPDEIIAENPALWQNLVEQAAPLLDFTFEAIINKLDVNKAKDKSLAAQRLLPLICDINDPVQQDHYLRKLAHILKVSESSLITASKKLQLSKRKQQSVGATEQAPHLYRPLSNPIEEYCLALLLQYPELRSAAQEPSAEYFECTENREIFLKWQNYPDIPALRSKLDTEILEHLDYLLAKTFPPAIQENGETRQLALTDCILRLQERLSRESEARREIVLNLAREKEGMDAELIKQEEQGTKFSQQLKEIFIKQGRPRRGGK